MKIHRHYLIAIIILLVIIACLLLVKRVENPWPLAICTPAAGVITFFGLLPDQPRGHPPKATPDERLRQVIAASVLVQYLVLVGISAYFLEGAKELPKITETMLSSFTTVTSVVIAFYFGASAFVDAKTKAKPEADAAPAPSP